MIVGFYITQRDCNTHKKRKKHSEPHVRVECVCHMCYHHPSNPCAKFLGSSNGWRAASRRTTRRCNLSYSLITIKWTWSLSSVYVCTFSFPVSRQHFAQQQHAERRAGGRNRKVEGQKRRVGGRTGGTHCVKYGLTTSGCQTVPADTMDRLKCFLIYPNI